MRDIERNEAAEAARRRMYDAGVELLNASLSEDLALTIASAIQHGVRLEFVLQIPHGDLTVKLITSKSTCEILRAVTHSPVAN